MNLLLPLKGQYENNKKRLHNSNVFAQTPIIYIPLIANHNTGRRLLNQDLSCFPISWSEPK